MLADKINLKYKAEGRLKLFFFCKKISNWKFQIEYIIEKTSQTLCFF